MISYKSTREQDKKSYTFSEALLKGIAEDGGLLVPETLPTISIQNMKSLLHKPYQEIATYIFDIFKTDIPHAMIKQIVNTAYAENFATKSIVPVVALSDQQFILELWHGPTSAFKDMALQIMPLFFAEAVKNDNANRVTQGKPPLKYVILVSTSGDTGKAALEGYKNKENISIIVLYPENRVAHLQERQMQTQEGDNVSVYALNCDFDAVQEIVKSVFNDKKFNYDLYQNHHTIVSSANSINWGRLVPQIIYYLSGYLQLVEKNVIQLGDPIDIAVPSGNFGNILAAFYAKKMGVPLRQFICAVNENHVLADFLQTGVYDISHRTLVKTPSPSMDILIASNIERLLYTITQNGAQVAAWMRELKEQQKFTVDAQTLEILKNNFYADWVKNADSLNNIKQVYDKTGYLMDPHTSVAHVAAERYLNKGNENVPVLIASTAHWSKFAPDIYHVLFANPKTTDDFQILTAISQFDPNLHIPANILALKNKSLHHTQKLPAQTSHVEDTIRKQSHA